MCSPQYISYYKFLGILFGVAVRTKKPLALSFAPFVWKLIVGEPVTIDDLEETDCLYVQSLKGIRDIHLSGVTEATFHEVIPLECFEGTYYMFSVIIKLSVCNLLQNMKLCCHL